MTKAEIIAKLEVIYKDDYDKFVAILNGWNGKEWAKYANEMCVTHNRLGVPYNTFCVKLGEMYGDTNEVPKCTYMKKEGVYKDKLVSEVNIGIEEHWGDIQEHDVCGKSCLCFGSELGGYVIEAVYDYSTGEKIRGRNKLLEWAKTNVWKYIDWYSSK